MKINTIKENLLEGIQIIQSALSPRTTLPVLQNFLMETENGKLKIVFTDLEMAIKHYIDAETQSTGSITIPAKKFSDILHTLQNDQDISITTDSSNKVHINSGKSRFWLIGTPKEEYPVIPDLNKSDSFTIGAGVLSDMIKKTIFAAATEETRYVLNGILWIFGKEGFEMIATDGRRLALAGNKNINIKKEFIELLCPKCGWSKIIQQPISNSREPRKTGQVGE